MERWWNYTDGGKTTVLEGSASSSTTNLTTDPSQASVVIGRRLTALSQGTAVNAVVSIWVSDRHASTEQKTQTHIIGEHPVKVNMAPGTC